MLVGFFVIRLAHPGGPLKTNKGAALAKFLERKLQDPTALASINPQLLELAVKNAKETIRGPCPFRCYLLNLKPYIMHSFLSIRFILAYVILMRMYNSPLILLGYIILCVLFQL